jgi:hypothetical protein
MPTERVEPNTGAVLPACDIDPMWQLLLAKLVVARVSTPNSRPFFGNAENHRLTGAAARLVPDYHTFFDTRFSRRELKRFVRIALD